MPGGTVRVEGDGPLVRVVPPRMTRSEVAVIAAIGLSIPLGLVAIFQSMQAVIAGALYLGFVTYITLDHMRSRNHIVFDMSARTVTVERAHPRLFRQRDRAPHTTVWADVAGIVTKQKFAGGRHDPPRLRVEIEFRDRTRIAVADFDTVAHGADFARRLTTLLEGAGEG